MSSGNRCARPHVHIGTTVDEFENACLRALQERSATHQLRRQDAVRHETWRDKVEQLSAIVEQTLCDRTAAPRTPHPNTTPRDAHLLA